MSLRVVDNGEDFFLNVLTEQDLQCHLISADFTPSDSDTAGSVTECADGSYSAQTIAMGDWVVSGGTATAAQLTFTLAGANTIYGYWVSDGSTMLWEEKLGSPLVYGSDGGSLKITPAINAD